MVYYANLIERHALKNFVRLYHLIKNRRRDGLVFHNSSGTDVYHFSSWDDAVRDGAIDPKAWPELHKRGSNSLSRQPSIAFRNGEPLP